MAKLTRNFVPQNQCSENINMFSSCQINTCIIHNTKLEGNTEKSSAAPSQRRPRMQEGAALGCPQRCWGFHGILGEGVHGPEEAPGALSLVPGEWGWAKSTSPFLWACVLTTEAPLSW